MKFRQKNLLILMVSVLLSSLCMVTVAAQDPRPSDGGSAKPGGSGGNGGVTTTESTCAAFKGQVLNWGVGGLGGIGIELKTGSWQVAATSASDGNYSLGNLGVGVAKLHVAVPPEQGGVTPLAQDAGVYLNCDYPVVANLAVYSGVRPTPPATIQLSAPAAVAPGDDTVIRVVVKNNLPTDISNVIVTSLMPAGLTAVNVANAAGNSNVAKLVDGGVDGQLVFAHFDRISPGATENILITVTAGQNLAEGAKIRNIATLFYQESVAAQNWVDLTVSAAAGRPKPTPAPSPTKTAPVTVTLTTAATTTLTATVAAKAVITPAATITAAAVITPTPKKPAITPEPSEGEDFVPPGKLPTTGEDFSPPPSMLPTTGDELLPPATLPETGVGDWLPLAGLGFSGAALALHRLRTYWQNRP